MTFELTEQLQRHLSEKAVVWLTTVTPSGRPAPRPVWFFWDGSGLTVYSQPDAAKLRHIEANDRVSLHFSENASGGDVAVISGRARRLADAPLPTMNHDYQEKYSALVQQAGFTAEWLDSFSVAIRVTPERSWAML
jgi:PPOX class probable F420-dependent enzyme